MKLILAKSIEKAELDSLDKVFNLDVLKTAAKKAIQGIGENIKSSAKINGTILRKVYLTGSNGAGRTVFLLQLDSKTSILVMIRLKNDKQIGANMTIKNPKFRKLLDKNIDLISSDLDTGNYTEYTL